MPQTETAIPAIPPKIKMGGSTKLMLVRMEQSIGNTNIPPTTPYFVNEIEGNVNLRQVKKAVLDSKNDRDSVYRVKAQLETVASTAKGSLSSHAEDLLTGTVKQALDVDNRLNEIESQLNALETERLKTKKEYYKAIESATNPAEKAATSSKAEQTSQSKIKEYEKEVAKLTKLSDHLYQKIGAEYTVLRESLPGNAKIKPFQDFSKTKAAEQAQQAPSAPTANALGLMNEAQHNRSGHSS